MFTKYYEEDMLRKLPMGQRNLMVGRVPLQRARLYQNLKDKPNIVTRLWSKMSRSIRNLTTTTVTNLRTTASASLAVNTSKIDINSS